MSKLDVDMKIDQQHQGSSFDGSVDTTAVWGASSAASGDNPSIIGGSVVPRVKTENDRPRDGDQPDDHDLSIKRQESTTNSSYLLDGSAEDLSSQPPGYDNLNYNDLDVDKSTASTECERTMETAPKQISQPPIITKSAKLSNIQSLFNDSQKMAYIGLCYLSIVQYRNRLTAKEQKSSLKAFNGWADIFMERLYASINVSKEEQVMIQQLADHGLVPSDLSKSLIEEAMKAGQLLKEAEEEKQRQEQDALDHGQLPTNNLSDPNFDSPSDVRYTVLSHLYILCICDGMYDARSRSTLRKVADELKVSWLDVIKLENAIAEQLRVHETTAEVKPDAETIVERNAKEEKGRWLFMGLATLGESFMGSSVLSPITLITPYKLMQVVLQLSVLPRDWLPL
jgi:hypothetical protein